MGTDLWDLFDESAGREIDFFPAGIKKYLARQIAATTNLPVLPDDTRKHLRITMNQCALAIRLSESDQPNGHIFQIYVKDISAGGIGFLHTRAFTSERLAIKLTGISGEAIVMVGRVVRCDYRQRAYQIGMEFTSRVTKSVQASVPIPAVDAPTSDEGGDESADHVADIDQEIGQTDAVPESALAER